MSWAIRNALPVPVLGARRRKLPTGRSLRQLTEARLRLRRSQALDPLVALGKLARPHFTSMRAPKQVQGSMERSGAGRLHRPRIALAHACRSEEHTSELQSLMRISYAVFCLK